MACEALRAAFDEADARAVQATEDRNEAAAALEAAEAALRSAGKAAGDAYAEWLHCVANQ